MPARDQDSDVTRMGRTSRLTVNISLKLEIIPLGHVFQLPCHHYHLSLCQQQPRSPAPPFFLSFFPLTPSIYSLSFLLRSLSTKGIQPCAGHRGKKEKWGLVLNEGANLWPVKVRMEGGGGWCWCRWTEMGKIAIGEECIRRDGTLPGGRSPPLG